MFQVHYNCYPMVFLVIEGRVLERLASILEGAFAGGRWEHEDIKPLEVVSGGPLHL